jgi:hypothetical protein
MVLTEIPDRRGTSRYRNSLVANMVQSVAGFLGRGKDPPIKRAR